MMFHQGFTMSFIIEQLRDYPFIALFLSLGLGYLIGKIKIGKFELGGISGSLLVDSGS